VKQIIALTLRQCPILLFQRSEAAQLDSPGARVRRQKSLKNPHCLITISSQRGADGADVSAIAKSSNTPAGTFVSDVLMDHRGGRHPREQVPVVVRDHKRWIAQKEDLTSLQFLAAGPRAFSRRLR
jgi:hypothetical protein